MRVAAYSLIVAALLLPPASECSAAEGKSRNLWQLPPPAATHRANFELGRLLFYDTRLSERGNRACASCHNPGLGWADGVSLSEGLRNPMSRHTPSLINIGYQKSFFWDGRATSLEEAILQHLRAPSTLQESDPDHLTEAIRAISGYRKLFKGKPPTDERIAAALAAYLREATIQHSTPFDRWSAGDETAISAAAQRGWRLFNGKGRCVSCHTSPLFSDSRYHNTGINSIDPGRFEVSRNQAQQHAFRTPSLRGIAETAPYMHTGSKADLREVLAFYNQGGDRPDAGNELRPLRLTTRELNDLLAFLQTLSAPGSEVAIPRLPPSGE